MSANTSNFFVFFFFAPRIGRGRRALLTDGDDATCRVGGVARGWLAGWVEAGGDAVFTGSVIRLGYEEEGAEDLFWGVGLRDE